jgi:hypothetical protein
MEHDDLIHTIFKAITDLYVIGGTVLCWFFSTLPNWAALASLVFVSLRTYELIDTWKQARATAKGKP